MPEALQVRLNVVVDPMLLLPPMLTEYGGSGETDMYHVQMHH